VLNGGAGGAGESTRASNRLRGLLAQIHPSLERVLGPRIAHAAAPGATGPFQLPAAAAQGQDPADRQDPETKAPRRAERLAADITEALTEQTVVDPGTSAAKVVVPPLARQPSDRSLMSQAVSRRLLMGVRNAMVAPTVSVRTRIGVPCRR
jgi:hypothetical protein